MSLTQLELHAMPFMGETSHKHKIKRLTHFSWLIYKKKIKSMMRSRKCEKHQVWCYMIAPRAEYSLLKSTSFLHVLFNFGSYAIIVCCRLFITGPVSHYFYQLMEVWMPSTDPYCIVKRLLLDRLFFAPGFLLLFYFVMNILEVSHLRNCPS